MVNKVMLIGNLATDPEVRATPSGVHVTTVRMATNTYAGKDESGNRKEHADFHQLVLFGRLAEVAGEYLHKGKLVYVEGRLQTRTWDDADGKKHYVTEVIVDAFHMLGSGTREAAVAVS